jgi:hypothetical protein
MSDWYDSQKDLSSNFRKSLLERIDKANPRNTLTAEEERRLSKLEVIVSKLKRGENVLPNLSKNLYYDIDTYSKEMCDEII